MPRPPFGKEPMFTTCASCGGRIQVPPGVLYRGAYYHGIHASRRARADRDIEVREPNLAYIERNLKEIINSNVAT